MQDWDISARSRGAGSPPSSTAVTSTSPALHMVFLQGTQYSCQFLGYKIQEKTGPQKNPYYLGFYSFPGGQMFHNKSARLLENSQGLRDIIMRLFFTTPLSWVTQNLTKYFVTLIIQYPEIIIIDLNDIVERVFLFTQTALRYTTNTYVRYFFMVVVWEGWP